MAKVAHFFVGSCIVLVGRKPRVADGSWRQVGKETTIRPRNKQYRNKNRTPIDYGLHYTSVYTVDTEYVFSIRWHRAGRAVPPRPRPRNLVLHNIRYLSLPLN